VERDLRWGKVTFAGALNDYGVLASGDKDHPVIDEAASDAERAQRQALKTGEEPFFDRGAGYVSLSGGRTFAEVDFL
jgi:N-methylhydantoinase B